MHNYLIINYRIKNKQCLNNKARSLYHITSRTASAEALTAASRHLCNNKEPPHDSALGRESEGIRTRERLSVLHLADALAIMANARMSSGYARKEQLHLNILLLLAEPAAEASKKGVSFVFGFPFFIGLFKRVQP